MRQVLHVDCDCFFAAVEMRDQPQYRHVPLAIGGASDRRGVISTCNYLMVFVQLWLPAKPLSFALT